MLSSAWPPAWLTPVDDEALVGNKAHLAIEFVENFGIITKDSVAGNAGTPLVLRDWQKELIRHLYASDGNGGFLNRVSLVGMPRKQGKSALASSLAVFDTYFGGRGAEVYSVAAEKEQARIVFADAKRMIEASPDLAGMAKLYRDAVEIPKTGSVYRVLSAESYSKEGLSATAVWMDELHAQKNRELFDVMSLSMGARGNKAHLVAITTAGVKSDTTGKDSIAYSLYQYGKKVAAGEIDDPAFFMAWWEAPADMDHKSVEAWAVANPGFEDIVSKADFESAVRRTPEAEFRTKRLNQWVSSAEAWLPAGAWGECEGKTVITSDNKIILGVDGSFSGDSTVVVGCTVPDGDELPQVFLVKAWEKDLDHDGDDWRVDIADVEAVIVDFCASHPNVQEIVFDPFRWARTMQILDDAGFPVVEYPQSPSRMIKACQKFFDAVVDKQLVHDGNPTLSRHLDNAVLKQTPAGPHIKKDARNSPRKIDAAVASIMAVDRALSGRIEEVVPQFFY
jgi:phage terminase large subunit-like protein